MDTKKETPQEHLLEESVEQLNLQIKELRKYTHVLKGIAEDIQYAQTAILSKQEETLNKQVKFTEQNLHALNVIIDMVVPHKSEGR